jgi:putative oxidoreductase
MNNNTYPTTTAQDALTLIGRVLIALLFVPAGWGKIAGFAGTVGYIASKGVPLPEVCAAIAIGAEFGLCLLLLVGYQARWAALGLGIFTFVISFIFHDFWAVAAEQVAMQRGQFFKNMAITGGLLAFAAFGAGGWSLDGRRRS